MTLTYPSGDEHMDRVVELLCDEWPIHRDYLEWDDRCGVVLDLLVALRRDGLAVVDQRVADARATQDADLIGNLRRALYVAAVVGGGAAQDGLYLDHEAAVAFEEHELDLDD